MKVDVKLFANLREIAGKGELELEFSDEPSLTKLLDKLSESYGVDFRNYVFYPESNIIQPHIQILVDGSRISLTEVQTIELKDGSIVAILPPVGGG